MTIIVPTDGERRLLQATSIDVQFEARVRRLSGEDIGDITPYMITKGSSVIRDCKRPIPGSASLNFDFREAPPELDLRDTWQQSVIQLKVIVSPSSTAQLAESVYRHLGW